MTRHFPPAARGVPAVLAVLMVATLVVAGCDRGSQTPEGGELAETPSPGPDDDATPAAVAPLGDTASPGPSTPSGVPTPGGDADQAAGRKVPEAGEPPPLDGLYSDDELEVARTMADYYAWLMSYPNTDPELVDKIFELAPVQWRGSFVGWIRPWW